MDTSTVLNIEIGEGVDKCLICLSPFEKQRVASLENCQHVFCFDCILQWSQKANTCPVDRIVFSFIHERLCPGGDIQKKIKVRAKKREDDDDDDDIDEEGTGAVVCEECGRSDRWHQLLVCTSCDSGYHMDCLMPSLETAPERDWICAECALSLQHTEGFMVEKDISDGELNDLLADTAENACVSSRLRPSTINRPSSSTERHSQRIRSRASANPHPVPQTFWHVPKYLLRASKPAATTDEVAAFHHSDTSSAAVNSKSRKRRKRAT